MIYWWKILSSHNILLELTAGLKSLQSLRRWHKHKFDSQRLLEKPTQEQSVLIPNLPLMPFHLPWYRWNRRARHLSLGISEQELCLRRANRSLQIDDPTIKRK